LDAGREKFLGILKLTDDKPVHARVYYGLARIAVLQKNLDLAEQLFRKTLELSPDPHTQSWTEVYLGRLYENTDTPQNALEHYKSALAVDGAPPGARQAAEQGIRKLETNK
jgi:tetratricopeptide (TPR) repeat protein